MLPWGALRCIALFRFREVVQPAAAQEEDEHEEGDAGDGDEAKEVQKADAEAR